MDSAVCRNDWGSGCLGRIPGAGRRIPACHLALRAAGNADANGYQHPHTYPHVHTNPHTHSHTNPHTDGNRYPDQNSHADGDAHQNAYSHADAHPNKNAHADRYAFAYAHGAARSYSPEPLVLYQWHLYPLDRRDPEQRERHHLPFDCHIEPIRWFGRARCDRVEIYHG